MKIYLIKLMVLQLFIINDFLISIYSILKAFAFKGLFLMNLPFSVNYNGT
jgi:hypothetical protein